MPLQSQLGAHLGERDDSHRTSTALEWQAVDPVLVEEAVAGVQLVGSAHAVGTAEHAYTQLLAERQVLFEAIDGYREAARTGLEVT